MKPYIVDLLETRKIRIRVTAIDADDACGIAEKEYYAGAESDFIGIHSVEATGAEEDCSGGGLAE